MRVWLCPGCLAPELAPLISIPTDKWACLVKRRQTHKNTVKERKRDAPFLLIKWVTVLFFRTLYLDTHLHHTYTHQHLKQNCSAFILLEIGPIVPSSMMCSHLPKSIEPRNWYYSFSGSFFLSTITLHLSLCLSLLILEWEKVITWERKGLVR